MSSESTIKTRAFALLARREHTRHELYQKLLLRQFAPCTIEVVLDWLAAQNYQSDRRFVESYIEVGLRRGYGILKIEHELKKRGIQDKALIAQLLPQDEDLWLEQITALWQKKFSHVTGNDWSERAKQTRFFQARGFTLEQIKKLWQTLGSVCK